VSDTVFNVRPLQLARIVPLILVGFSACSLELPGAGDDFSGPDADPSMDAGEPDASDEHDAGSGQTDAPEDGSEPELDADPAPACDAAALGEVEQRTRYAALQVVAPARCVSETQERTCTESGWSEWSGMFQSEACSASAHPSCGAVAHGARELRTRFLTALADDASGCASEQQLRTCTDGSFSAWSGTYQFVSCVVPLEGECALDSPAPCQDGTSCAERAGQGLRCLGTPGFGCNVNEQCVATCVDDECAPKAEPGGACDDADDCTGCSAGGVDCVDATCRCDDGAACDANAQCQNTCVVDECAPMDARCDDDEDCNDERECLRKGGVLAPSCLLPDGSDCASNAECQHVCRASECDTAGANGEDCDENADCALGLVCRTQQCAQRATVGQGCDESADCAAGMACVLQICLKGPGQACTLPIECISDNCSSSGSGPSICRP
jgi:hypothetical protein